MKTQTYQPAELHTFTEELGLFVVTGERQELEQVAMDSFRQCKHVSQSAFDRAVYGPIARKRRKHLIELALF